MAYQKRRQGQLDGTGAPKGTRTHTQASVPRPWTLGNGIAIIGMWGLLLSGILAVMAL